MLELVELRSQLSTAPNIEAFECGLQSHMQRSWDHKACALVSFDGVAQHGGEQLFYWFCQFGCKPCGFLMKLDSASSTAEGSMERSEIQGMRSDRLVKFATHRCFFQLPSIVQMVEGKACILDIWHYDIWCLRRAP